MKSTALRIALCAWLSIVCLACAPGIGDECETALNCSAQGSRLCDRTQPKGYCTIRGCDRGSCPDDAVCVKFRPTAERLAVTYCMATCDDNSDCRDDDGYRCTTAAQFGTSGGNDAEVLGSAKQRFCSAKPKAPIAIGDSCRRDVDCAADGSRVCDRTQLDGYCTIAGCDRDGCPSGSACVGFGGNGDQSLSYCMATCKDVSDCRTPDKKVDAGGHAYACAAVSELGTGGDAGQNQAAPVVLGPKPDAKQRVCSSDTFDVKLVSDDMQSNDEDAGPSGDAAVLVSASENTPDASVP